MQIKRYINVIIGVLFLAAAVALWAMPADTNTPPRSIEPARVSLGRVSSDHNRRAVRFAGVIQAKNRAELSFALNQRRHIETNMITLRFFQSMRFEKGLITH